MFRLFVSQTQYVIVNRLKAIKNTMIILFFMYLLHFSQTLSLRSLQYLQLSFGKQRSRSPLSHQDDPEPSSPQNLKPSLFLLCGTNTRSGQVGFSIQPSSSLFHKASIKPGQVDSPNFQIVKLKAYRKDHDILRSASRVSRYLFLLV